MKFLFVFIVFLSYFAKCHSSQKAQEMIKNLKDNGNFDGEFFKHNVKSGPEYEEDFKF